MDDEACTLNFNRKRGGKMEERVERWKEISYMSYREGKIKEREIERGEVGKLFKRGKGDISVLWLVQWLL